MLLLFVLNLRLILENYMKYGNLIKVPNMLNLDGIPIMTGLIFLAVATLLYSRFILGEWVHSFKYREINHFWDIGSNAPLHKPCFNINHTHYHYMDSNAQPSNFIPLMYSPNHQVERHRTTHVCNHIVP